MFVVGVKIMPMLYDIQLVQSVSRRDGRRCQTLEENEASQSRRRAERGARRGGPPSACTNRRHLSAAMVENMSCNEPQVASVMESLRMNVMLGSRRQNGEGITENVRWYMSV